MRRRISTRLFGEDFEAVWLGRFRVIEAIGYGCMGVVYCAEDDQLDRHVAVKVLREEHLRGSARGRDRLLRDARALTLLSHPNVVQVHEVGEHEDGVFMVMELVRGTSLGAWLAAEPRPLPEIVARFIAVGQGLAAAHRVGVVHRDFRPADALIGEDGRVRVVDFGLARCATSEIEGTARADAVGSLERRAGSPGDARGDQFSFCAALFEAVYGRAPGCIDPERGQAGEPASDRPVPRWLRRLLERGLATHPEQRHASMSALLAALSEGPRRRRALHCGVTGGLALALVLTLAVALAGASVASRAGSWCVDEPTVVWGERAFVTRSCAPSTVQDDVALRRWLAARREACAKKGAGWDRVLCLVDLDESPRDLRE